MNLHQKSFFKPNWEYEIQKGDLVITERSFFNSQVTRIPLQAIDPTPSYSKSVQIKWLIAALAVATLVGIFLYQGLVMDYPAQVPAALFLVPFLAAFVCKFFAQRIDNAVFDYYEGNGKSYFRMRRDQPTPQEFAGFVQKMADEGKKIRYRDDIPDDKRLEIVHRHLEYLHSIELLTDKELEALSSRARKKYLQAKVSLLKPAVIES